MDEIAALKPDWADYFTVNGNRRIDLQDASIDVMQAGGPTSREARPRGQVGDGAPRVAAAQGGF